MLLARRLVNGRERGCLQVVPCIVLRLVNMSTRAMRLKTQARVLACLQVVYPNLSVVKEQSPSASLVRLEKELFPLYLASPLPCFSCKAKKPKKQENKKGDTMKYIPNRTA